jgi:L-lactate dehydrogenase complex protein LldG
MALSEPVTQFQKMAAQAGSHPVSCLDAVALADYIARHAGGTILLPSFPSGCRLNLVELLRCQGCEVVTDHFRSAAPLAAAGITGANFALADTGTVVLDSTEEPLRLASTFPERHFVLLDPRKILPDGLAAVGLLRALHRRRSPDFIAFITGPSRTADIERVLTIGVHGPRELHILLLEGLSDDPLES